MSWKREPGLVGWAAVLAVVTAADVWASKTNRRTMSSWVAVSSGHNVAGPVVFGVAAGLGWHLFAWPLLSR